jgi:hypothetical protein
MSALNIPKPWHPKCKTNPVSFGSDGKSRASLEIIVHVSLPSGAIPLLRFPEWRNGNPGHAVNPTKQTMSREYAGIVFCKKRGPVWSSGYSHASDPDSIPGCNTRRTGGPLPDLCS